MRRGFGAALLEDQADRLPVRAIKAMPAVRTSGLILRGADLVMLARWVKWPISGHPSKAPRETWVTDFEERKASPG